MSFPLLAALVAMSMVTLSVGQERRVCYGQSPGQSSSEGVYMAVVRNQQSRLNTVRRVNPLRNPALLWNQRNRFAKFTPQQIASIMQTCARTGTCWVTNSSITNEMLRIFIEEELIKQEINGVVCDLSRANCLAWRKMKRIHDMKITYYAIKGLPAGVVPENSGLWSFGQILSDRQVNEFTAAMYQHSPHLQRPPTPPPTCPPTTFAPRTFPPQTFPPRTFPPRTFPPQTFAPRTFPPRTFPPRTFPPRTFPPQTFPPRTFPPQTFPPRTFPPQTFPPRTFPPQTFPPQTFPPPTFAPQTFPPVTFPVKSIPQVVPQKRRKRAALFIDIRGIDTWPTLPIPYTFGVNFSPARKELVRQAISDIEEKTCIRFDERPKSPSGTPHIFYNLGTVNGHCGLAGIGRTGNINIIHIHLNFEQCLQTLDIWDQDDESATSAYGTKYDYFSIMHYSSFAAAVDTSRPTIRSKTAPEAFYQEVMGQRAGLSLRDADLLTRMYCAPDCTDMNVNCGWWMEQGICKTQFDEMLEKCPKSCGFCPYSTAEAAVRAIRK